MFLFIIQIFGVRGYGEGMHISIHYVPLHVLTMAVEFILSIIKVAGVIGFIILGVSTPSTFSHFVFLAPTAPTTYRLHIICFQGILERKLLTFIQIIIDCGGTGPQG